MAKRLDNGTQVIIYIDGADDVALRGTITGYDGGFYTVRTNRNALSHWSLRRSEFWTLEQAAEKTAAWSTVRIDPRMAFGMAA